MTDLETVLKRSLEHASAHSRKVYGQNPLTAREILELANSKVLILGATVKPGGRPHLSPIDFLAVDGTLYLGVDETTARYRNLKHNPVITIMIADGWKRQAIMEGTARFLDIKDENAKKVLKAQKKKYGWITEAIAEFSPEKVFTWKSK